MTYGIDNHDLREMQETITKGLLSGTIAELYYLKRFDKPLAEELDDDEVPFNSVSMVYPESNRKILYTYAAHNIAGQLLITVPKKYKGNSEVPNAFFLINVTFVDDATMKAMKERSHDGYVSPNDILNPSEQMQHYIVNYNKLAAILADANEAVIFNCFLHGATQSNQMTEYSQYVFPVLPEFMFYLCGKGEITPAQLQGYQNHPYKYCSALTDVAFGCGDREDSWAIFPDCEACDEAPFYKLIQLIAFCYVGQKDLQKRLLISLLNESYEIADFLADPNNYLDETQYNELAAQSIVDINAAYKVEYNEEDGE